MRTFYLVLTVLMGVLFLLMSLDLLMPPVKEIMSIPLGYPGVLAVIFCLLWLYAPRKSST